MENISEKAKKIIANVAENEEMKEIYLNYISLAMQQKKQFFGKNWLNK